jgi:UDPglucose 6-dehydrogenase
VITQNQAPRLAFWGLAYKQDTHSVKNSPALALAESLGQFEKIAYDPEVKSLAQTVPNLSMAPTALEACRAADALLVLTPWREFSEIDPVSVRAEMRGRVLLDPYGIMKASACSEAGFSYHTLGS